MVWTCREGLEQRKDMKLVGVSEKDALGGMGAGGQPRVEGKRQEPVSVLARTFNIVSNCLKIELPCNTS